MRILQSTEAALLAATLLFLILAAAVLGFHLGKRWGRAAGSSPVRRIGDIETAMFAMLGLILAFTFSMASQRFESHRELIVEEANAIGTATLRSDLYPAIERAAFRASFKDYLEARIAVYESGPKATGTEEIMVKGLQAEKDLWERAARLSRDPANLVASNQMVPALNAMFDLAASRLATTRAHVPETILWLLLILTLGASFLCGYNGGCSGEIDWLAIGVFAVMTAAVIYTTLDLERPLRGLIRLDTTQQSLLDLRQLFSADEPSVVPVEPPKR